MKTNLLLAGSMAFVFAGCAASNGGGYVVGNSAIPANTAQKMAKEETCACGMKHEAGKDHKACGCSGKKVAETCAKEDGKAACTAKQ